MVTLSQTDVAISLGERVKHTIRKIVAMIKEWCCAVREYDAYSTIEF